VGDKGDDFRCGLPDCRGNEFEGVYLFVTPATHRGRGLGTIMVFQPQRQSTDYDTAVASTLGQTAKEDVLNIVKQKTQLG